MKLNDIAHGRSGDKGDTANVGIRVFDPADYEFLTSLLTEEYLLNLFESYLAEPTPESVETYELPQIHAVNVVLRGALDGGASESLYTDSQAKTFASLVLRQDVSDAYTAESRSSDERPRTTRDER